MPTGAAGAPRLAGRGALAGIVILTMLAAALPAAAGHSALARVSTSSSPLDHGSGRAPSVFHGPLVPDYAARGASPVGLGLPAPSNLTVGASEWSMLGAVGPTPGGSYSAVGYDSASHSFIAFGGESKAPGQAPAFSNATWEFSSAGWTNLCQDAGADPGCSAVPPARGGALMVWDAADGMMLMAGGRGGISNGSGTTYFGFSDLWGYSAGRWTNLSQSAPPPGLWDGAMVYDAADGYVLALTDLGSSWRYSHGNWSAIASTDAPSARTHPAVYYDSVQGRVVLYGGETVKGHSLNDTWSYARGVWTALSPAATPTVGGRSALGRVLPAPLAAAFDPNRDVGVLFDPSGTGTNETWLFTNETWENASSELRGPAGNSKGASLTWDPDSSTGLLVQSPSGGVPLVTWVLSDPLRIHIGSVRGLIDAGQTITFGASLTDGRSPYTTQLVSGPTDCSVQGGDTGAPALECGIATPGGYNATLQFSDSAGRSVQQSFHLSVNPDPTVVINDIRPNPTSIGVAAQFFASAGSGTLPYAGFSWSFDDGGGSTSLSPSHKFSSVGTHSVSVKLTDALGFAVTAKASLLVNNDPAALLSTNVSETDAGLPVSFSASVGGGTGVIGCAWNFGDGATSASCTTAHAFRVLGSYTARFWGNDSVGAVAQANVTLGIAPPVQAVIGQTFASALVGQAVPFQITGLDGIAPYTFAWSFGDGGFAVGSNVSHSFGLSGRYAVTATITDAAGARTSALETVSVQPANGSPGSGGGPLTPPPASGSMQVPSPRNTPAVPPGVPWWVIEIGTAVLLAVFAMLRDRRRRRFGGPTVGWIRRLGRALGAERRGSAPPSSKE